MSKGLQMKYFVLKPLGIDAYAEASRCAMMKYADVIWDENPELASELREWSRAASEPARLEALKNFKVSESPGR